MKIFNRIYYRRGFCKRPNTERYIDNMTRPVEEFTFLSQPPREEHQAQKDEYFMLYLAKFPPHWWPKYPELYNLGVQVQSALSSNRTDWCYSLNPYTEVTWKEFHGLFSDCLRGFTSHLKILAEITLSKTADHNRDSEVKDNIELVVLYGSCLRPLIKSWSLQRHLQCIMSSPRRTPITRTSISALDDGPNVDENDAQETEVEPLEIDELENIPIHVKPGRDWLKLITAEFDAANVLIQEFVLKHDRNINISIDIVTPPSASNHSLPWTDLFTRYIKESKGGLTNAQLLWYLTNVENARPESRNWLDALKSMRKAGKLDEMELKIKEQEQVETYQDERKGNQPESWWRVWLTLPNASFSILPDWPPILDAILAAISSKKEGFKMTIDKNMALLQRSYDFFGQVVSTNDRLFGNGRIHCEACLASLVAPDATASIKDDGNYKKVLKSTKVGDRGLACFRHYMGLIACG